MPKPTDLSYYNWETQTSTSNSSPNFQVRTDTRCGRAGAVVVCACNSSRCVRRSFGKQVIADNEAGLLFKNKRDRKVINVDPSANPGDNSTRTEISTKEYLQVVIYDHMTRRKS